MTTNKRVVATLKFPTNIPAFIIYVRGIILKLTGNPSVPAPYPTGVTALAACTTNINNLETAEALVQTHASGSVASRDTAHEVSKKDMRSIRGMVQQLADNNLPNASIIIESAGLSVKAPGGRKTIVFEAKNTLVSGTVKLVAPSNKGARGSHQWFYTTDLTGFTNKVTVMGTTKASTTIDSLVEGTKYAFFHSAIVPTGINTEDGPVFLTVI
jgi:hypothetical protein